MTCNHEWTVTDDGAFACIECGEPCPICNTCARRPADRGAPICDACITREQGVLDRIRATIDGVPDTFAHLLGLKGVSYDRDPVQGGDDTARLPHGLDRTVDDWYHGPAGINTRTGALQVLWEWAGRYAELRHEHPSDDVIAYLRQRVTWAATTLDPAEWADYRAEVRTVNGRIQALTETPTEQRTGSDCLDCGGRLVQLWTTRDGLDDHIICSVCGRQYTYGAHALAVRAKVQRAPAERPDATVTAAEARRVFPTLGTSTVRVWANRGDLTPRGKNRRGEPLYLVADIAERLGVFAA